MAEIIREYFATTKNGIELWYDPVGSHAATHFADSPGLQEMAKLIVEQTILDPDQDLTQFHTDMGKPVGMTDLVVNNEGDVIIYAMRKNRTNYTPFNKSQPPQPSSLVTICIKRHEEDHSQELFSAWVGPGDLPPMPGSDYEQPNSKEFWTIHSLAWGTQEIQPGTETSVCPWV